MNVFLDIVKKETGWKSPSRLMGEACERYVVQEIRCPRCMATGSFVRFPTNEKFKDVYCDRCLQNFQIKKSDSDHLLGGDYFTTRNNLKQVDFLVVKQSAQVFHIPYEKIKRRMVVPRRPLSANARRAGWRGCVLRFPPEIQNELLYWIAKRPRTGHPKGRTARRSRRTQKGSLCRQCPVCKADT